MYKTVGVADGQQINMQFVKIGLLAIAGALLLVGTQAMPNEIPDEILAMLAEGEAGHFYEV
ncbi:hypothetical protein Ciccas_013383 [Cichlidogyrus casuarinus]|uniref:Uncharacterized protein n=1 Tax=Cichlidogyrus casuarinus TaxID=1844966 RepID=A0ABD2PKR6_9PLAT